MGRWERLEENERGVSPQHCGTETRSLHIGQQGALKHLNAQGRPQKNEIRMSEGEAWASVTFKAPPTLSDSNSVAEVESLKV